MPRTRKISPATLPGALPGQMPEKLAPVLAALVAKPQPEQLLFAIKFDGYRMLARIDGDAMASTGARRCRTSCKTGSSDSRLARGLEEIDVAQARGLGPKATKSLATAGF